MNRATFLRVLGLTALAPTVLSAITVPKGPEPEVKEPQNTPSVTPSKYITAEMENGMEIRIATKSPMVNDIIQLADGEYIISAAWPEVSPVHIKIKKL